MERKNFTEVVIDSRIYRLGGYESEEYLHQVASYLNNKISEMKTLDGYSHLSTSSRSLMLNLNTADDYFKAKKQADRLEEDLSDKDRELYEVKHELVSLQVKAEETEREIEALNARIRELEEALSGKDEALSKMKEKIGEDPDLSGSAADVPALFSDASMEEEGEDSSGEVLELPELSELPESPGTDQVVSPLNFNKRRKNSQRGWKR